MLLMKSTTSPTLSSGAFTQAFGEFEKVTKAVATVDQPDGATAGLTLAVSCAISGNNVIVTITQVTLTEPTDGSRVWANAANITGKTVTVLAEGE